MPANDRARAGEVWSLSRPVGCGECPLRGLVATNFAVHEPDFQCQHPDAPRTSLDEPPAVEADPSLDPPPWCPLRRGPFEISLLP